MLCSLKVTRGASWMWTRETMKRSRMALGGIQSLLKQFVYTHRHTHAHKLLHQYKINTLNHFNNHFSPTLSFSLSQVSHTDSPVINDVSAFALKARVVYPINQRYRVRKFKYTCIYIYFIANHLKPLHWLIMEH